MMGPLWLDINGRELDAEERELLAHPLVGGVILFARNYHDSEQLCHLTQSIRQVVKRPFLIGVDQEGGRVQRFKDSFSIIPPAKAYAEIEHGEAIAKEAGWLMAIELIAHDIDLSFAPVLDKGFACKAITTRAFGDTNANVITYSHAFMSGMKTAGMATTGKHFPGHGAVLEDSHVESPKDLRNTIIDEDMAIFLSHIKANLLDAIMPAHVIYPHYDNKPASGSEFWLKTILRKQLKFNGIVFSDDLTMEGANVMGGPIDRAEQALLAGCDMLLLCNDRDASIRVIDHLPISSVPQAVSLLKKQTLSVAELKKSTQWKTSNHRIQTLNDSLLNQ